MLLQSCMDAAMTGAQVVYNRHNLKKGFDDQYTTAQVFHALNSNTDDFKNANISIATFNGKILLAGQVPETWQKIKAENIVKEKLGKNEIYNLLTVGTPSSTMTRISDAWLTTKVKAKLLASNDLDATQIKVVTENGTVYLMGILQPKEADAAVLIASNTEGVQSVVKIFSYMNISEK